MTTISRSQKRERSVSLRTMWLVAIACFMAGAILPSRMWSIAVPLSHAATPISDGNEYAFLKENGAAMSQMMTDMTVKPSGDVNRDFVDMMIPHHQGAIDMAKLLLLHGDNEVLRRIAQEIMITQQQEIVAMRLAIGESEQPMAAPSATPPAMGNSQSMQMPHDSMKMK